jgi:hypothetical protein
MDTQRGYTAPADDRRQGFFYLCPDRAYRFGNLRDIRIFFDPTRQRRG